MAKDYEDKSGFGKLLTRVLTGTSKAEMEQAQEFGKKGFELSEKGRQRKINQQQALMAEQAKEKARTAFKRLKKVDLKALEVGLDSWIQYWKESSIDAQFIPLPATWINQKRWEDDIPSVDDKDPEFKSDLDKELFNRNKNIIEQSKRMRDYLKEANDKADEVPDLLADYKENKKSNAKSIKEVIGQMDTLIKSDSSTDAK